jgi:hypothetical protein
LIWLDKTSGYQRALVSPETIGATSAQWSARYCPRTRSVRFATLPRAQARQTLGRFSWWSSETRKRIGIPSQGVRNMRHITKCSAVALLLCLPAMTCAAPPATTTASRASSQSDWTALDRQIGRYPDDIGLFTTSPIVADLKRLLGNRWSTFLLNMGTVSALQRERVLYVTGNKPHEGGDESAYLMIDTSRQALEVGLVTRGKLKTFRTPGPKLPVPKDVRIFVENLGD